MSGRFVRSSKYRHVFGRGTRKDQCYDNLRVSRNAWDTNLVKANPQYLSVNWEAGGGGAFAVIPLNERGRLPARFPLFRGHTSAVLDTDWNPFNDSLVASGADDGKIFLWRVPEGFTLNSDAEPDEISDIQPVGRLSGHPRKVGQVLFNPAAENVIASASGDFTIKIWDIEAGSPKLTLNVGDIVQSLSWSANGSLMSTTSRDKKLRIWDVRQERPVHEGQGHSGAKNSRGVWMGEHDRIATTGFSKMSDRQLALWDIRAPREPLNGFRVLDSISGVCVPFWDDGTQCLYLAGKGDGNIRYFEYENDKFEYLSEYKSADPQRGIAFMPKRGVNMHENEVVRVYKTVNDSYIEPISFIVPRRAEVFQDDIYPPCTGLKPAMSSGEWFGGKEGLAPKIDLASLYEGEGLKEVAAEAPKPAAESTAPPTPVAKEPEPTPRAEPEPKPAPTAVTASAPPPTMKEQSSSIAAIASKYDDASDDKAEDMDDTSSFEEVPKPAERAAPTSSPPLEKPSEAPKVVPVVDTKPHTAQEEAGTPDSATVHREMMTMKSLLDEQNKTIAAQTEQMQVLTAEIESLKAKIG